MKVSMNTCVKKYADLEEGADDKSLHIFVQKPTKCSGLLNGVKVILCLELVILVGWLGFIAVDTYVGSILYRSRMESYDSTNSLDQINDTSNLETTAAVVESTTLNTDESVEEVDTFKFPQIPLLVFGKLPELGESSKATEAIEENTDEDENSSEDADQSEPIESTHSPANSDSSNYDYSDKDGDYVNPLANINFWMGHNEKETDSSVIECSSDEILTSLQPNGLYGLDAKCIPRKLWLEYLTIGRLPRLPSFPSESENSDFSQPPSDVIDYL